MQVDEVMTPDPACCSSGEPLQRAAEMMVECDCGEIPVTEEGTNKVIGVITDRDITCRTVARGLNPLGMTVSEVMSTPVITVKHDASLEECCSLMEQRQVRRIPVVDGNGACVGIVSLADIAEQTSRSESGEILREVSSASASASSVA